MITDVFLGTGKIISRKIRCTWGGKGICTKIRVTSISDERNWKMYAEIAGSYKNILNIL